MRPVPPRPSSRAKMESNDPPPLPRLATPPPTVLLLLPVISGRRSVVLPCLLRIDASTAAAAEGVLCSGVACLEPSIPRKPCSKPDWLACTGSAGAEVRGRRVPGAAVVLEPQEEDTCPICSAVRARKEAVRPAAPGWDAWSSPSPTVPPLVWYNEQVVASPCAALAYVCMFMYMMMACNKHFIAIPQHCVLFRLQQGPAPLCVLHVGLFRGKEAAQAGERAGEAIVPHLQNVCIRVGR